MWCQHWTIVKRHVSRPEVAEPRIGAFPRTYGMPGSTLLEVYVLASGDAGGLSNQSSNNVVSRSTLSAQ